MEKMINEVVKQLLIINLSINCVTLIIENSEKQLNELVKSCYM